MFCPNCGGEYADWAQRCPYCGSVNEAADEKLYLEHMENLRKRLDSVDEESEAEYRQEVGGHVKKVTKILLAIVAVIAVIAIATSIYFIYQNKKEEAQALKQNQWEQEEYPKLDQWYEAEEYDKILDEYYALLQDDEDFNIYNWEHYDFIDYLYAPHEKVSYLLDCLDKGESYEDYDVTEALYGALCLKYQMTDAYVEQLENSYSYNKGYGLSEKDASYLPQYQEDAMKIIELAGWTEAEGQQFYEENTDYEVLKYKPCEEKAEEMIKKMEKK